MIVSNTVGGQAIYDCVRGLALMGSPTRVCGDNGEWLGEAPVCEGLSKSLFCGMGFVMFIHTHACHVVSCDHIKGLKAIFLMYESQLCT